jgi:hypothetical protein
MRPNDETPGGMRPRPEANRIAATELDASLARALEQARARWGTAAIVSETITTDADGRLEILRFVGRQHEAFAWSVLGVGSSWRSAFAEADRAERGRP